MGGPLRCTEKPSTCSNARSARQRWHQKRLSELTWQLRTCSSARSAEHSSSRKIFWRNISGRCTCSNVLCAHRHSFFCSASVLLIFHLIFHWLQPLLCTFQRSYIWLFSGVGQHCCIGKPWESKSSILRGSKQLNVFENSLSFVIFPIYSCFNF